TMPSRTFRLLVRCASSSATFVPLLRWLLFGSRDLALAEQRLDTGHLAPELRDARDVVELSGRVLEAKVEELFLRLPEPVLELGVVELPELLCLRHGSLRSAVPLSERWVARCSPGYPARTRSLLHSSAAFVVMLRPGAR